MFSCFLNQRLMPKFLVMSRNFFVIQAVFVFVYANFGTLSWSKEPFFGHNEIKDSKAFLSLKFGLCWWPRGFSIALKLTRCGFCPSHRASLESAGRQNSCDHLNAFGDNQLPHWNWCVHASTSMHCGSLLAADCHLMYLSGHKKYCAPKSVRAL